MVEAVSFSVQKVEVVENADVLGCRRKTPSNPEYGIPRSVQEGPLPPWFGSQLASSRKREVFVVGAESPRGAGVARRDGRSDFGGL